MISPFFTPSNVKLPSMSVMFPLVVPFTTTDAPATGPKSSSTTPVTFPFCWEMAVSSFSGAKSAYTLAGSAIAPAARSKLTCLKCFNIMNDFIDNTSVRRVLLDLEFDVYWLFYLSSKRTLYFISATNVYIF